MKAVDRCVGSSRRVFLVAGIAVALVVSAKLAGLLLAMFGSAVLAVLLSAMVDCTSKRLHLGRKATLVLVIAIVTLVVSLGFWFFGAQIHAQLSSLQDTLPQAYADVEAWLEQSPAGRGLGEMLVSASSNTAELRAHLAKLLSSTTSIVGQVGLLLVGGVYLAADPELYRRGVIRLFPVPYRPLAAETLLLSATALRYWILGQLVSMLAVGIMTAVGLWLLDVPASMSIALLTAALGIVPIVGPIAAAVPAALLGFTVSPETALWVIGLYIVVQQVEGNVLQPIIQKRAVELPPAILLFSLFGIGVLCGPIGVLLAAPLTVVLYVVLKRVYITHILEGDVGESGKSSLHPPLIEERSPHEQ